MAWYRRFVNLMRSERLSRDLEREMAFHLSERADELVAGGLSEPEALREARKRFGNRTLQKERMRDADVLVWLESLLADLRYAARALRASPGFALVAILSLGLGIGANTAIFSLIDAVMLKSLPVSHPAARAGDDRRRRRDHQPDLGTVARPERSLFQRLRLLGRRPADVRSGEQRRIPSGPRRLGERWVFHRPWASARGRPPAAPRRRFPRLPGRRRPQPWLLAEPVWRRGGSHRQDDLPRRPCVHRSSGRPVPGSSASTSAVRLRSMPHCARRRSSAAPAACSTTAGPGCSTSWAGRCRD